MSIRRSCRSPRVTPIIMLLVITAACAPDVAVDLAVRVAGHDATIEDVRVTPHVAEWDRDEKGRVRFTLEARTNCPLSACQQLTMNFDVATLSYVGRGSTFYLSDRTQIEPRVELEGKFDPSFVGLVGTVTFDDFWRSGWLSRDFYADIRVHVERAGYVVDARVCDLHVAYREGGFSLY